MSKTSQKSTGFRVARLGKKCQLGYFLHLLVP